MVSVQKRATSITRIYNILLCTGIRAARALHNMFHCPVPSHIHTLCMSLWVVPITSDYPLCVRLLFSYGLVFSKWAIRYLVITKGPFFVVYWNLIFTTKHINLFSAFSIKTRFVVSWRCRERMGTVTNFTGRRFRRWYVPSRNGKYLAKCRFQRGNAISLNSARDRGVRVWSINKIKATV